jgi:hypothetical protein
MYPIAASHFRRAASDYCGHWQTSLSPFSPEPYQYCSVDRHGKPSRSHVSVRAALLSFARCLIIWHAGLCYFRRRGAWLNAALSERCYSGSVDFSPLLGILLLRRYTRTAAKVHCERHAVGLFWPQVSVSRSRIDVRCALY